MNRVADFTLHYNTNEIGFLKEGFVRYDFKNLTPIEISLLSNDFSRNSILIKNYEISNNSVYFRIKSFEPSNFNIPAFYIRGVENGITNTYLISQVNISTTPYTIKVTNIQPIEEIFDFVDILPFLIILALILIFGSGYLIFKFLKKSRSSNANENRNYDPFAVFIESLNRIEKEELNEKNYKEIFVKISEIIRNFLEGTLKFNAPEMSTTEIENYLKKARINYELSEFRKILREVLKLCDRVKYAKHLPSQNEKQWAIENGKILAYILKNEMDKALSKKQEEEGK